MLALGGLGNSWTYKEEHSTHIDHLSRQHYFNTLKHFECLTFRLLPLQVVVCMFYHTFSLSTPCAYSIRQYNSDLLLIWISFNLLKINSFFINVYRYQTENKGLTTTLLTKVTASQPFIYRYIVCSKKMGKEKSFTWISYFVLIETDIYSWIVAIHCESFIV